jgi:hypothetical protein
MNKQLNNGFTQVCVWPSTLVDGDIAGLTQFFLDEFNTRIQYLEEIVTGADSTGPGGRNDVLFAVHDDDVMKFAVPRFKLGVRWIEDVYGNGHGALYPERVAEYQCWTTA